jgi:hypothetical protein
MKNSQHSGGAEAELLIVITLLILAVIGFATVVDSNITRTTTLIRVCEAAGQFQYESTVVKCQVIKGSVK